MGKCNVGVYLGKALHYFICFMGLRTESTNGAKLEYVSGLWHSFLEGKISAHMQNLQFQQIICKLLVHMFSKVTKWGRSDTYMHGKQGQELLCLFPEHDFSLVCIKT